ncbi:L-methionine/branched-chain amino acid transporter [Lonsdalea quercina]|uniref:L-methionine/branched-chain amino acid transporter n=1 Tax=Lonsdalea quercina TaxID=71657 RepID=UPI003976E4B3
MSEQCGKLSLHQGVGFLVSTLLGSGVFIVPAMVAGLVGPWAWLAWLSMTLLVLPVVFTFALLGRQFPHSAGTAHFVELAYGHRLRQSISWLYLSVIPIGPPVAVITGANYLVYCLSLPPVYCGYFALLMLSLILIVNTFNVTLSGNVQFGITVLTALVLISAIVVGLTETPNAAPQVIPTGGDSLLPFFRAMGIIFWCFVGIEAVAHLAPEFASPERDFPRTMVISLTIALSLYCLLSYTVLRFSAFGNEVDNISSLPRLIGQAFGRTGAIVTGLMGFLTCLAAVNLYIISFTRLIVSMKGEGALSRFLAYRNRFHTPVVATLFAVLPVAITVALKYGCSIGLESLIACANGVFVMIYLAASLSACRLLRGHQRVVALLASLFCLGVACVIGDNMRYAVVITLLAFVLSSWRQRQTVASSGEPEA